MIDKLKQIAVTAGCFITVFIVVSLFFLAALPYIIKML